MMVLDVQRVLDREPKAIEPLLDEVRAASGTEPRLARPLAEIEDMIKDPGSAGRRLTATIALAVQAALLVRHAPPAVADAFCASRLDGDWRPNFGTLPPGADIASVIEFGRLR
jgi:putative acyl-CoA dehydrogenase